MINYLYNANGNAVGFSIGRYIYQLSGRLIGQINNTIHAHKVTGEYVGVMYKGMVVNMRTGNVTKLGNCRTTGNVSRQPDPGKRELSNFGYEDMFIRLLEG